MAAKTLFEVEVLATDTTSVGQMTLNTIGR